MCPRNNRSAKLHIISYISAELRKREGGIDKIIRHAVKGMLPKGPLGRSLMDNLYVYEGTEHKHEAQKPKAIDINQYK